MAKKKTVKTKSIEESLWDSANKLRGSVESAEYKHVVLGLTFLKYAGDKFDQRRTEIKAEGQEKHLEQKSFYTMKNVFFLEESSRWSYIISQAKQDDIAIAARCQLLTCGQQREAKSRPKEENSGEN